jgi:UDP-3-O-[3-hydroxymyristoyl] glucosamine N-acyltransferase
MAGQSGLAGSVTLGDGVMMGGGARVKVHKQMMMSRIVPG